MSFSNSLAAPLNCLPPHGSPAQSRGCSTIDGRAMSFTPRRPRTDSRQLLQGLGFVRQARDYFRGRPSYLQRWERNEEETTAWPVRAVVCLSDATAQEEQARRRGGRVAPAP